MLKITSQNAEVMSSLSMASSPKSPGPKSPGQNSSLVFEHNHVKAPGGGHSAAGGGMAVRHVRRSHSGKAVRVKKDGAGSKETWGKLLDTDGESFLDGNVSHCGVSDLEEAEEAARCLCGDLAMALSVFDEMPEKDVVSWTSMVSGELQVIGEAADDYEGMQNGQKVTFPGEADEAPDMVTGDIVFVLQQKEYPKFQRKGSFLSSHTLENDQGCSNRSGAVSWVAGCSLPIRKLGWGYKSYIRTMLISAVIFIC
ncbi:hypothetical protein SASPL_111041 [Salvia splendens]|uniref:Chaperone DnaJ C-terminal domain-containing protein n=1 Tax=Salvia splendens TaxID=180675 RepID=A0A8X9A2Z8_SALSN|nr:hypothetical protein SASPL_111041 [Salvia splendens]